MTATSNTPTPTHNHAPNPAYERSVRRARTLNRLTIGWNVIEGIVAVIAGIAAGSLSLIGFGLDSGIEVSAALILAWRLAQEGTDRCMADADRRAQRGVALSFAALAAYLGVQATIDVVNGHQPDASTLGIILAAVSLVVMPVLARAKRRTALEMGSRAGVAEASQTDLCTMLSAALLIGLGANALFGWWWADSIVAVGIAVTAAWLAVSTWRADSLADTCC